MMKVEGVEVERWKKSIEEAEQAMRDGLITDPEARSQLGRMIYHYSELIKKYEKGEQDEG